MLQFVLSVILPIEIGRDVIAAKPASLESEKMRQNRIRKIAPLLILFFVLSTITAPARAIIPLIAGGVMALGEGSVVGNALVALTVGSTVGIIYMGSQSTGSGTKSGSIMDIPLGTSRDRPLDTPAGYTPPANNDAQPLPPASTASTTGWVKSGTSAPVYGSQDDACRAYGANFVYDVSTYCKDTANGQFLAGPNAVTVCGVGYTLTGGACALSAPAAVMKPPDGRCQILASVSGFSVDSQDPECGDLAANGGVTVAPGKISSKTAGGSTEITINPDGSRTIVQTRANADGKTSTITTINLIPAVGGQNAVVSGTSVVVVNGQGSAVSPAASALPDIKFPDDYNREATQSQIKTSLDALKSEADTTGYVPLAPAAQTPKEFADQENAKITTELSNITGSYDNFKMLDWSTWIPTFPTNSCSPFTGSVMGKTIVWDFCPKIAMLNELIGWMLNVFAAWSVVYLMFRRDG